VKANRDFMKNPLPQKELVLIHRKSSRPQRVNFTEEMGNRSQKRKRGPVSNKGQVQTIRGKNRLGGHITLREDSSTWRHSVKGKGLRRRENGKRTRNRIFPTAELRERAVSLVSNKCGKTGKGRGR